MFFKKLFPASRGSIIRMMTRVNLGIFLLLIYFLPFTSLVYVTADTFPVALEVGDTFVYKVLDDHIFVSINETTYLNDTYLKAPAEEVQVEVLGLQNVSDLDAIWGLKTIVNQSETVRPSNETRNTFSYVNGWIDAYHTGLIGTLVVFSRMENAPWAYKFQYHEPSIQKPQVGLPVFVTTNGSYFERLMKDNPPTNGSQPSEPPPGGFDIPPYTLSYEYDREQGIYVMNHTMTFKDNGTLTDNVTEWSLELKFEFYLDSTFSKSIVNELKTFVYWNVRVGNASDLFEWGLYVSLKSSGSEPLTNEDTTGTKTIEIPSIAMISALSILPLLSMIRRKNQFHNNEK